MGRYAGWIALFAGVAGGADVILIPEVPFTYESIEAKIRETVADIALYPGMALEDRIAQRLERIRVRVMAETAQAAAERYAVTEV